MVKVDGEKMAKSLGNFITIRQLLDKGVEPMAVRLFVLTAQYRKPIDFTDEAIQAATNGWNTLKEGLVFGHKYGEKLGWDKETSGQGENSYTQRFQEAVNNDFNFSSGLSVLFELAKELGKEGNILVHQGKTETAPEELQKMWQTLVTLADVLGLVAQIESEAATNDGLNDQEIQALIQERKEARKSKNFAESDRIRDELQAQGIALIDSKEGTKWHRNQ